MIAYTIGAREIYDNALQHETTDPGDTEHG